MKKHKNETECLELRKLQNKLHYDKVKKKMVSESEKALAKEKEKLRKRKSRELAKLKCGNKTKKPRSHGKNDEAH